MSYHLACIDNQQFFYSSNTTFYVQVGKGKSGYRTRYSFTGDLRKAVFYYTSINIGNGYKKRLLMDGNNKALARQFS